MSSLLVQGMYFSSGIYMGLNQCRNYMWHNLGEYKYCMLEQRALYGKTITNEQTYNHSNERLDAFGKLSPPLHYILSGEFKTTIFGGLVFGFSKLPSKA